MKSDEYGKTARKALEGTEEKKPAAGEGKGGRAGAKGGGKKEGKVISHIVHTPHADGSHHLIHKHHPPHHEAKHDEHHDLPDLDALHDHMDEHMGGMSSGGGTPEPGADGGEGAAGAGGEGGQQA